MTSLADPAVRAKITAEPWDVVVIGAGMGGAAIGHRLVDAGQRVLFLEKGGDRFTTLDPAAEDDPAARLRAGHWPDRVRVEVDGSGGETHLPLGCGVGGSTNLFSAALERFERSDVEATPDLPHPTGGWPVAWPVWEAYYAEAERALRVRGEAEALAPLPAPSAMDAGLSRLLSRNGLKPYGLNVGIGYCAGCTECGGRKCAWRCKSDAQTIFVDPALATGRASLVTGAEVLRLDSDDTGVRGVVFRQDDGEQRVAARAVVLAAGAYHSPALLLRSANAHWPAGLANASGLVGRNLMFHANEWLAVWPKAKASTAGPRKTIGCRDHYRRDGKRYGAVQSTGLIASFGNICGFLMARLALSRWRIVPGADKLLKLAALVGVGLFGDATIFVMLVEDFGLPENRVTIDPDDSAKICVSYTVGADLRGRTRRARRWLKRSFAGARTLSLQGDVQLNLGHACGTCRFGSDPATSVLDPDCRAHGLDNLYVVDASFMPTSGGANPALTIAANALRVGDVLAARLRAEGVGSCKSAVRRHGGFYHPIAAEGTSAP